MNPYITTALTVLPVIGGLVVLVRFKLREAKERQPALREPVVYAVWQEDLFFTKNQRLAAIASERAALIAERKRLTKNKKRRSHIDPQLRALTNEELRLEGSR